MPIHHSEWCWIELDWNKNRARSTKCLLETSATKVPPNITVIILNRNKIKKIWFPLSWLVSDTMGCRATQLTLETHSVLFRWCHVTHSCCDEDRGTKSLGIFSNCSYEIVKRRMKLPYKEKQFWLLEDTTLWVLKCDISINESRYDCRDVNFWYLRFTSFGFSKPLYFTMEIAKKGGSSWSHAASNSLFWQYGSQ